MPPSISLVYPMFNEAAYLQRAVAAASHALSETTDDYQIVIVNDASTDETGSIADAVADEDPRITVVHNATNLKLGGTLRAGYAAATKELIVYTDADLPFDLLEIQRAVRLLEYQEADVVSAYRFDRTREGYIRTVYSFVYSLLIRLVFGLRIKDVNFSFKIFRHSLLDRFPLKSDGSFIDAEFLIRSRNAGAGIIQIGVDYFERSRGISTLSSASVIVKILKEMIQLYPELRARA